MKTWVGIHLIFLIGMGVGAWALDKPPQAQPLDSDIPSLLYETDRPENPIFVGLEAVRQSDGSLDTEHLPYLVRRELESAAEPSTECVKLLGPVPEIYGDYRRSLDQALKSADWVFIAEVEASAQGFFGTADAAGTLLKITPMEVFKGPSWHWPRYIFMPIAEFTLAGHKFCTVDSFYAPLPEIGDRVLLLVDLHSWNRERKTLDTGSFTGIVTLPLSGQIGMPKRYRKSNPELIEVSSDDFLAWARKTIGGAE